MKRNYFTSQFPADSQWHCFPTINSISDILGPIIHNFLKDSGYKQMLVEDKIVLFKFSFKNVKDLYGFFSLEKLSKF